MNYQLVYDQLIFRARSQVRSKNDGYYEEHHILPRSMGGNNKKENLVLLTAREHFVAHHLLWRQHRNYQMALAFRNMRRKNKNGYLNSREYERVKIIIKETLNTHLKFAAVKGGKVAGAIAAKRGTIHKLNKVGGKAFARKGIAKEVGAVLGRTYGRQTGIAAKANGNLTKARNASAESRQRTAKSNWYSSLKEAGFSRDYRPASRKQAKELGLKRYWGAVCARHPELEGQRETSTGKCPECKYMFSYGVKREDRLQN